MSVRRSNRLGAKTDDPETLAAVAANLDWKARCKRWSSARAAYKTGRDTEDAGLIAAIVEAARRLETQLEAAVTTEELRACKEAADAIQEQDRSLCILWRSDKTYELIGDCAHAIAVAIAGSTASATSFGLTPKGAQTWALEKLRAYVAGAQA